MDCLGTVLLIAFNAFDALFLSSFAVFASQIQLLFAYFDWFCDVL